MKKAKNILLTIGTVMGIVALVFISFILLIYTATLLVFGVIMLVQFIQNSGNQYYYHSSELYDLLVAAIVCFAVAAVYLILFALCLVEYLLSFAFAGKMKKAADMASAKKAAIGTIVMAVLTSNYLYLVAAILGLVNLKKEYAEVDADEEEPAEVTA